MTEKIIQYLDQSIVLLKLGSLSIQDMDAIQFYLDKSQEIFQDIKRIRKEKFGHGQSKQVRCIETGKIYPTLGIAANSCQSSSQSVYQSIQKGTKIKGRFSFEYIQE